MKRCPLVAVPGSTHYSEQPDKYRFSVEVKYLKALMNFSNCLPVMVPALNGDLAAEEILGRFDGLFLTGNLSNIDPQLYGQEKHERDGPFDPLRDSLSLDLIKVAVKRGLPVFGVCRGLQEINVALGGTLRREIQDHRGFDDHRSLSTGQATTDYGARHALKLQKGGYLEQLCINNGYALEGIKVNSLHRQGVDLLSDQLQSEAVAPDGLIEALSLKSRKSFCLGVQWHPEYETAANPFSRLLFRSFGDALSSHP